jgi:glycosyltransferase involved in cell wall biosynthesis
LLFPGIEDFGIVPMEALACGAAVVALGEGGVAETVDDRVGRTYAEATPEALAAALDAWEAAGCPNDPALGRARAEAFAVPRFRERLLGHLAEVASGRAQPSGPIPAPHWGHRHAAAPHARA